MEEAETAHREPLRRAHRQPQVNCCLVIDADGCATHPFPRYRGDISKGAVSTETVRQLLDYIRNLTGELALIERAIREAPPPSEPGGA